MQGSQEELPAFFVRVGSTGFALRAPLQPLLVAVQKGLTSLRAGERLLFLEVKLVRGSFRFMDFVAGCPPGCYTSHPIYVGRR